MNRFLYRSSCTKTVGILTLHINNFGLYKKRKINLNPNGSNTCRLHFIQLQNHTGCTSNKTLVIGVNAYNHSVIMDFTIIIMAGYIICSCMPQS